MEGMEISLIFLFDMSGYEAFLILVVVRLINHFRKGNILPG